MRNLKQSWEKWFPRMAAWERTIQLQSVARATKVADEVAHQVLLHDDGKGVSGQVALIDRDQTSQAGDEMGDITIVGDVTESAAKMLAKSKQSSIVPALAKLGVAAMLGSSGLGAAYLIGEAIRSRPVAPSTPDTDTDTVIEIDLPRP